MKSLISLLFLLLICIEGTFLMKRQKHAASLSFVGWTPYELQTNSLPYQSFDNIWVWNAGGA